MTENLNRMDFLRRAAKAGISIAAAGSLSLWLHDRGVPGREEEEGDLVQVPDFSLPELSRRIATVTGTNRRETVGRAIEALGGMEVFIKTPAAWSPACASTADDSSRPASRSV